MKGRLLNLVARDSDDESASPTMIGLLITLLVLVLMALGLIIALYFMRSRKRLRQERLPIYEEKRLSTTSRYSHHRSISVRNAESIIVYQEKQNLIDNSDAPPTSPVPEIRITFPEEVDDLGKRKSGKVVVVRVGDHSIGLEPVSEEKLPAYQTDESDRFQSLDLDRIGGLTEKEVEVRFS